MLLTICCVVFACYFSLGQSVSPPRPFDCIPTYRACESVTDCPKSYPVCDNGRCCRRPVFPPLCPLYRRGPRCGGILHPECKPGYSCLDGYCCRDLIPTPTCPRGMSTGPVCIKGDWCPKGYNCHNGRCCKKRTDVPSCPPFLAGPPCSKGAQCKGGYTCLRGTCCRDLIPLNKCPKSMTYTGSCFGDRICSFGSRCIDGACCRKKIPVCPRGLTYTGSCFGGTGCGFRSKCINDACCREDIIIPPPIFDLKRCPPQPFILLCPSVVMPPRCRSDSECREGEKCCPVNCRPDQCVPAISGLPGFSGASP